MTQDPDREGFECRVRAPLRILDSRAPKRHILIACMPKSGSSFLNDVIRKLPTFHRAMLVPDMGRREHELDETCLKRVEGFNYVAQHHVRYSDWTGELCRTHNLTPIVLTRSMLDVVVSKRDHIRREGAVGHSFFAESHHAALSDADLEDMIARLAMPWYVNFYMGWRRAPGALLIDHSELASNPISVVEDILSHAQTSAPRAVIEAAIDKTFAIGESRMNVGVQGRGNNLRPDTIRRVMELLDFYPEAEGDAYIKAMRSQARAALCGTTITTERPAPVTRPQPVRRSKWSPLHWPRKTRRAVIRRFLPAILITFAAIYWILPYDLIPDSSAYGYLDDATILLISSFFAGRLTKYK